jgi:hypothetical protein
MFGTSIGRADGPAVLVAAGADQGLAWRLVVVRARPWGDSPPAHPDVRMVCIALSVDAPGWFPNVACRQETGPGSHIPIVPMLFPGRGDARRGVAFGTIPSTAARVRLYFDAHEPIEVASLPEVPRFPWRYFVAFHPRGAEVTQAVAFEARGREVSRIPAPDRFGTTPFG